MSTLRLDSTDPLHGATSLLKSARWERAVLGGFSKKLSMYPYFKQILVKCPNSTRRSH